MLLVILNTFHSNEGKFFKVMFYEIENKKNFSLMSMLKTVAVSQFATRWNC